MMGGGKMKHAVNLFNGDGELLKEKSHAAYCKYLIKAFKDDADGSLSYTGTINIIKEGLNEEAFKKLLLYFLFHRGETYTLQTAEGQNYRVAFVEFNAFSGEGTITINN
jgi:hypothetical protein